ncbi:SDR family oxidoreductase [Hymenobacter cheonanensis]|uniref:SDR family oxidoreductase n=1 Tax=Hymenobacter sp. CA2-7 TaxID=3063993 RepID=UPI002712A9AB|nr:SDR family oxidoreductase [Hymenobacter sp. CA2-7]MDO7885205.1 SDR family oxidoreductase [Hymenobacter sp. CA2-7]
MKILLTGSNGLLGQKLVALLHQAPGVELVATARGANRLATSYPTLHFVPLDVTDLAQVQQVLARQRPTHVIHTAAMTQVDDCELNQADCWTQNVTAVAHLAATCAQLDVHLTHLSTDFIFNGTEALLSEEALPDPISHYGASKLAAEQVVQSTVGLRWAIARTVLVYGTTLAGGRSNLVLWVYNSLRNQQAIKVVSDQWRTPTLAEDLAQGCWLLARQSAQGIFHLSGRELLTPYQMAQQVAAAFQLDATLVKQVDSQTFTQAARRPPRTGFRIAKAERELGYRPHSFTEGLALVQRQLAQVRQ